MPSENVTLTATFENIYTVTFTITSGSNPVEGAIISINGQNLITNNQGIATLGLVNGTYSYSVSKDGFANATGNISVSGADVNQAISLTATAIEPELSNMFKAYPNPFINNITLYNENGLSRVIITNVTGNVMLNVDLGSAMNYTLETNLPVGIYLVTLVDINNNKTTYRMVKK